MTTREEMLESLEQELLKIQKKLIELSKATENLAPWLSAALEDPAVCDAMKQDIRTWFEANELLPTKPKDSADLTLLAARGVLKNISWDEKHENFLARREDIDNLVDAVEGYDIATKPSPAKPKDVRQALIDLFIEEAVEDWGSMPEQLADTILAKFPERFKS